MIAMALTKPETLGLPFAAWTLDRLAAYLHEHKGHRDAAQPDRRNPAPRGLALAQARDLVRRAGRSSLRGKKGAIETLYTKPPAGSGVICLDEMGPVSAKSYAGRALVQSRRRDRPSAQDRRSTTAGAPKAISLARFVRPPARPSPIPILDAAAHIGSTFWNTLRAGSRARPSGCTRSWTTWARIARPTCCCSCWPIRAGRWCSSPIRGLSQPDRALVEDPALPRIIGSALRDLGGDRRCDPLLDRLLECTPPSLCLGQTPSASAAPLARHRPAAEGRITCRMHH